MLPNPDPDFIKKINQLNGTPKEILQDKELMKLLLPILRADFSVLETYNYAPRQPFNFPITALGGFNDPEANETELVAWCQQTNQSFQHYLFPGDHFFIHSAELKIFATLERSLTEIIRSQV